MASVHDAQRRRFLQMTVLAGGGFAIGVALDACGRFPAAATETSENRTFAPNAWVRITPDNVVTIVVDKSEMGQGVWTSMPMLVAEELDADWREIRLEQAPAADVYRNPKLGLEATGGSSSVSSSYLPLRSAGAAARAMLVAAAAQRWGVPPDAIRTRNGVLHGPGGKTLTYGQVAVAASKLAPPRQPKLKSPDEFVLIGKPVPRTDVPSKVDGSAVFGIDAKLPGLLFAAVAHCPVFGGTVRHYDAARARAVPGVKAVIRVTHGVAVVATDYWTAHKALAGMPIEWNDGGNSHVSSDSILREFEAAAEHPGAVAENRGDTARALHGAAKVIHAEYRIPFQAHATMEPMNCTADVRRDSCELWVPTQNQTGTQARAAQITGLPVSKISVHTTMLGGGFGRRFETDFVDDAVRISKAVHAPVKVIWSREEDMTHDVYRPAVYSRLTGALDHRGRPIVWSHRLVGPSIMSRVMPEMVKNGIDPTSVQGAIDLPYDIPNVHVDYVLKNTPVPVGFWRSVGNSYTGFIKESFVDELAHAAGRDPYEFRRQHMRPGSRNLAVLELAAARAGWGKPAPAGISRGIAVHRSFGSYAAQVAEVSVRNGEVRVHRVVCAVDCGTVVNPDTVAAQIESAVIFAMTGALKGPITVSHGRVEERNFDTYPMVRMNEAPEIEVHIVQRGEPPSGLGEPGVPPLAPAVGNAIFAATGKRMRTLPIKRIA
ncbi:MAG: xanthine dehydrogenase family protein molybdopterin-binding subunit [Acidiferrobacteraceae bacterium]